MRSNKTVLPAKLSPPRLKNAVAGERLFAWIDTQRAEHAAIWISGVPGAGKTTLVASYCQSRTLACLWYRLDADDNDLGRFFALFGQAADATVPATSKSHRPIFEAAHAQQPRAFARTWLRYVFATLLRPFALVLDNLEHAAMPGLPEVLECAIEELPDGITLQLTSRHAPSPALARALMNGALADTYRPHPLLREFLLERGRQTLNPDVRRQLLRRAAHGFAAMSEHDVAIDLSIEACHWDHVSTLLLTVFEAKLARGQLDQLAA